MANSQQLVDKINLVRASRFLVTKGAATEHFPITTDTVVMEKTISDMIFAYTKYKFKGCRIRPGDGTVIVKLESEVHLKARKLREAIMQNSEWKRWFDENHRVITDTIAQNDRSFQNEGNIQYKTEEQNHLIHIPTSAVRVRNFQVEGLNRFFKWIDEEYQKDTRLAGMYESTVELMENEIRRREEAREQRIERERTQYLSNLKERSMPRIRHQDFDRSGTTTEGKFKQLMFDYCIEHDLQPAYAVEITPEMMLPKDTGVRIIAPPNERENNWFAVPMFGGYEMPEGYVLKDRWGKVTDYNTSDKRSRDGVAPVVLDGFVFTSFDMAHWAHTLPTGHAELLVISQQMRERAEVEAELARVEAEAEEARRNAQKEADRQQRLEEQQISLRARLAEVRSEEKPVPAQAEKVKAERPGIQVKEDEISIFDEEAEEQSAPTRTPEMDALAQSIKAQLNAKGDALAAQMDSLVHEEGVYRNSKGLSIEKYVVVRADGRKEFFRTNEEASNFAHSIINLSSSRMEYVYDYWQPKTAVEHITRR